MDYCDICDVDLGGRCTACDRRACEHCVRSCSMCGETFCERCYDDDADLCESCRDERKLEEADNE